MRAFQNHFVFKVEEFWIGALFYITRFNLYARGPAEKGAELQQVKLILKEVCERNFPKFNLALDGNAS